jgi:hypothetical membrane protein
METVSGAKSCDEVFSRWWHRPMVSRLLLMAGIAAVVVYVVGDAVSGVLFGGYSFVDQAISELSAFGSPVRPLMVTVILIHGVLVLAFGVGVLRSADWTSLRAVGALLLAIGAVGLPTHTIWAMSSREMETGFNDTMHIILSLAFSLAVFAAVVLAGVAYGGWFRLYSLATLAVLVTFGAASSIAIRGIEENDTPWAGAFERVNVYAYFAWLVVLTSLVMRSRVRVARDSGEPAETRRESPIAA